MLAPRHLGPLGPSFTAPALRGRLGNRVDIYYSFHNKFSGIPKIQAGSMYNQPRPKAKYSKTSDIRYTGYKTQTNNFPGSNNENQCKLLRL